MTTTRDLGIHAEEDALAYLTKQGLTFVASNYSCKPGEIDLIMKDQDYYVFVEVRSRTNANYGGGIESITRDKQRKVMRAATHYLVEKKLYEKVFCRFDVVVFSLKNNVPHVNWIKNAFEN